MPDSSQPEENVANEYQVESDSEELSDEALDDVAGAMLTYNVSTPNEVLSLIVTQTSDATQQQNLINLAGYQRPEGPGRRRRSP